MVICIGRIKIFSLNLNKKDSSYEKVQLRMCPVNAYFDFYAGVQFY